MLLFFILLLYALLIGCSFAVMFVIFVITLNIASIISILKQFHSENTYNPPSDFLFYHLITQYYFIS